MWPARSPDLTPCDFFLWGYVKEEVYKTNPQTLDQLETTIRNVIGAIPIGHLTKSCESVRDRVENKDYINRTYIPAETLLGRVLLLVGLGSEKILQRWIEAPKLHPSR